jgi:hypothetical protein
MALVPTGIRPELVDRLEERGVAMPGGLFGGTEMWQR